MRDERPRPDVLQKRCAKAAAKTLARQRHNGHAHIECIAGCTAAGVRKRVERDIHAIVRGEIALRGALCFHTLRGNPRRHDPALCLLPCIGAGEHIGLEQEAALRHTA